MATDDIGLWCEFKDAADSSRPALFLDRDGIIVDDTHYLGRAEDVRMIDGVAAAIARCNRLRIPVVVVTNQSGIARGLYDWSGFRAVQEAIVAALAAGGAHLDAVFACAYHGEGSGSLRVAGHPWRKPNPGMILAAGKHMNLDLARSWIVGDKPRDLAAGAAAGLAGGILASADERDQQQVSRLVGTPFLVETAAHPADALAKLVESGRLAQRVQC
ncbi:MAG: D-glycero-alpha-D-manno-heptose-1,7-bisphosphate 7-phosphatase [Xanthobacteraceae bacterium]